MPKRKVKLFRASSEPLYMACPQAARGKGPVIDWPSEAAAIGSAVHEACSTIVRGVEYDEHGIAYHYCLDENALRDFRVLCNLARKFWRDADAHFPQPQVEVELERAEGGLKFTGHPDVMAHFQLPYSEGEIMVTRVLDWKTTRKSDADYRPQMMRYLWLASKVTPADKYQYMTVYLRDQSSDISPEYTAADLDDYHKEFLERVVTPKDPPYCPGAHCAYCRRLAECPAQVSLMRETGAWLDVKPEIGWPTAHATLVKIMEQVKTFEGMIDRFRSHVRSVAEQSGGRLVGSDGRDLVLIHSERDEIDARAAWPILTARLTPDELAPCVEIHKTALLDAIAAKTPKGKGAARSAFMAELEAAAAVTKRSRTELRIVKAEKDNDKLLEEGCGK